MIEDAINYPRKGEGALTTILIGGVLGLLGVLVVPVFLLFGYYVRVLRTTLGGEDEPPAFEEWGDLLVDGLKAVVVAIAYVIVPAAVVAVSAGGVAMSAIVAGEPSPGAIAGSLLGFALGGVLWLLAWYALPAALASFVREDRVGAAFSPRALGTVLLSGSYVVNWIVALALFVLTGVVVGVLSVIPPLGFVVGAFANFYVAVVAFRLYGRAYDEAMAGEPASEAPAGQPAA